jgi:hypothetical protein
VNRLQSCSREKQSWPPVHIASLKTLLSLHGFDPVHQGSDHRVFVIVIVLQGRDGVHGTDGLLRSMILGAIVGHMANFSASETSTFLLEISAFGIRESSKSRTSALHVDIHGHVFKVKFRGRGLPFIGGSRGVLVGIRSHPLGRFEDLFALAPSSIIIDGLLLPFCYGCGDILRSEAFVNQWFVHVCRDETE